MDKKALKTYLLLISFTIGLVLVVVYFREILRGIGFFFKLLTPLWAAIVIAFVLNRPYEWFRRWYERNIKLGPKYGYPAVIVVSALVILICLWIMKKKKFW